MPETVIDVPPAESPEVGAIEKMIRCENSEVLPEGSVAVVEVRAGEIQARLDQFAR